ncbi:metalloregulator ArsR/SmtB family transcription factor [Candidatus Micrarchaeota archaeon]|nr:metalloregulator ArsR/SmtB family transcription factor [Candidatus Micrarchaeota archaeon]
MEKRLYLMHADVCKVLSNHVRLEILDLLRDGERSVSELIKKTGLSQANISQHLSLMKQKRVVVATRRGKNVFYKVSNPKIIRAFDLMRNVLRDRLRDELRFTNPLEGGKK